MERLNSQLSSVWQEKNALIQEVSTHQKMLQQSQDEVNGNVWMSSLFFMKDRHSNSVLFSKVQELEESLSRLREEMERLHHAHRLQEEMTLAVLQKDCKSLRQQNEELLNRVSREQQIALACLHQ